MLDYISALSILVPLIVSFLRFTALNRDLKILTCFFVFATVIETSNFIEFTHQMNNLWLLNIFALIEGAVFFYLCAKWFDSLKAFRAVMLLFGLYFIYWIYTTFITGNFFDFNDKEKTLKGILLIVISGYLLIRISAEDSLLMTKDYRFWILSAILIYFSVSEVVFATAHFVLENQPAIQKAWAIHSVINIISNLLFAIGFACSYQKMSFST
jgi:hypothetical protein